MFPPPNTRAPDEDQLDRQRSVLELSSLLQHAWWECDDHEDCASKEVAGLYHQRTRLEGNRVGLLVDPGAHDNLVGGLTADRMAEQVGTPNKQLRMSKSLQVEGVGQNSQSAEHANRIALKLRDVDGCDVPGSFTAPVIQGSALPPLLGLRSLRQVSAVLDTKGQKLYLPGAGGLEIECSPGTRVFDLELSPSGHLILPIDHNFVEDPMKTVEMQADWILLCQYVIVPVLVKPQLHAVNLQQLEVQRMCDCGKHLSKPIWIAHCMDHFR